MATRQIAKVDNLDQLTKRFDESRAQLLRIVRMLGSLAEAEDAVQETWLRLNRANADEIDNLDAWLTTVIARVCLDMLRSRKSRREDSLKDTERARTTDPEQEAILADSIGTALLVVLQTLGPAERIAFILHDVFSLPFEEIAPIVDRTPTATRQLASRARRRIQGTPRVPESDMAGQRRVLEAFTLASRSGDLTALLATLAPDAYFHADATAAKLGGPAEARGAEAVAALFNGRAQAARLAMIDGNVGIIVAPRGRLFLALLPRVLDGKIVEIEVIGDAQRLSQLSLGLLG